MPKAEKVEKVRELADRFRASEGALFSDFRGLSVKDITDLRRALREEGAAFVVAKNTLTRLAAKEAGLDGVEDLLVGPTGIVFAQADPIAAARALAEAGRRHPSLQVKGAYVEGQVLREDDARALATIEAKEVSVAKIAGLLQSPVSRVAYLLQAPLQRIAYALAERGRQEEAA
jgi:large subunit ribosomal protein L10